MVKMLPLQGLHGLESVSNSGDILIQQQMNPLMYTKKEGPGGGRGALFSSFNPGLLKSSREQKSQEAANKHALAERNRRKRINSHLNTLRQLFPHLPKRDKPRVLMETVKYIKELRKRVADRHVLMENGGEEGRCNGGNGASSLFLPSEKDELNVSYCEEGDHDHGEGEKTLTVKAMICCEDRPRLNRELTEAVKSVKGKVVKAEMATIGGRTKAVLVVQWQKDGGGGGGGEPDQEVIGPLKRALKAVVENRALGCSLLLGSHLGSSSSTRLGFELAKGCTSISSGRPLYGSHGG